MFCEKCGSLMFPEAGKLVCRNETCNFSRKITDDDGNLGTVLYEKRPEVRETLVLDEIIETLPKTRAECPRCGHYEAFWLMRQTRAADEPTTRIYRCARCNHTWREY